MLIVNFKGEYVAKVAFKAHRKGSKAYELEFANDIEKNYDSITLDGITEKEVLVVMDCKIKYEETSPFIDKDFSERFESVKTAIDEEKKKSIYVGYGFNGGNTYNAPFQQNWQTKKWEKPEWQKELEREGEKARQKLFKEENNGKREIGSKFRGPEYEQFELPFNSEFSKKKEKTIMEMTDQEYEEYLDSKYPDDTDFVSNSKEKSIMEMTDKEWKEFEESDMTEIGRSDCFLAFNKYCNPLNNSGFNPSIAAFAIEKRIKEGIINQDEWLTDFSLNFRKHFDELFGDKFDNEDYIDCLQTLEDYFVLFDEKGFIGDLISQISYMLEQEYIAYEEE